MGNPFTHIDLQTSDPAAAKKFYKEVFDWKFQEMPEMNWTGVVVGKGGVGGGIGAKQPGDPSPNAWTAYVDVADVKKTVEKAAKHGATVLMPYMEIGNMGAIGVFADPTGAVIGVWQAAKPRRGGGAAAKRTAKKAAAKKPAAKKAAKKPAAKKPAAKKKK